MEVDDAAVAVNDEITGRGYVRPFAVDVTP
jgi:hypothetical protein